MPSLGMVSYSGWFLLGTTAPDAFDPESEDSFARYHCRGEDGRISLQKFLENTNLTHRSSDNSARPFLCGYYCHLWLDVFFRDNADSLPFNRPADMPESELRRLVRRETEILNAPFVLSAGNLPDFDFNTLKLPSTLEFIDSERCMKLFREVVEQSQAWSVLAPEFEPIDPLAYADFLENAAKLCLDEIQSTAQLNEQTSKDSN
jgi:hypothetical protein